VRTGRVPPGSRLYYFRDGRPILLKDRVIVSGENVINAQSGLEQRTGSPMVSVTLDAAGGRKMLATTKKNVGRRMAVVYIENRVETVTTPDGRKVKKRSVHKDVINAAVIRDQFANQDRHLGLPLALALSEYRWFQTRRGDDRLAFGVVDDLNVNVLKAPIDGQSWPLGAAGNLTPHSFVSNDPSGLCGLGFRHLLGSPGALAWFDMDYFAGITDSLAGIHVGRPHLADFRRLLAYRLFVDSHYTNAVVAFNL